jgi:hypothetical protein
MNKLFLFFSLALVQCISLAQAPAIEWQKSFGGSTIDEAKSVQQNTDGSYIIAGYTQSNNGDVTGNHGNSDYWVVKLATTGYIQWQKTLGGTGDEYAYSIQQTSDGGYIVAGYTNSNNGDVTGNHGNNDYWVVKLSDAGIIQWQKTFGGTQNDYAYSIQQTRDGGYIVAGSTSSNDGDVTGNHGGSDMWILKLSATGNIQWQKALGGTYGDAGYSIQQTTDGGYIAVGFTASSDGDVINHIGALDDWVVKLTNTGTIEWQKSLGGTASEIANSVEQTSDGGYIIAGITRSYDGDVTGYHGGNGYDYWIVKLSGMGIIQWQKTLGGTEDDYTWSIKQTMDGGYVVGGSSLSNDGDISGNHGNYDFWVVKLSNTGAIQWQKTLGGNFSEFGLSIQVTSDGGSIVAGSSGFVSGDVTTNQGSSDCWVVKLAPDPLSSNDLSKMVLKVFPNPATARLTIQNPDNFPIDKIIITDLAGKTVQQQEQNVTQINVEQLASGTYILQAYSGEKKYTTKFLKK